jgi:hypothetical protein
MERMPAFFLSLALICSLSQGVASAVGTEPAESKATTLEQLSWMVGSWAGTEGGVQMEEHWTSAKGGIMLGLHRDVFASGRAFFEYLRIESTPKGLVYWASPRGQAPTPFRLSESGETRVVFENPDHDWPQRLIYWREKDGSLGTRAEGEEGGKFRAAEWRWTRTSLAAE